jgi:hypothetical protein
VLALHLSHDLHQISHEIHLAAKGLEFEKKKRIQKIQNSNLLQGLFLDDGLGTNRNPGLSIPCCRVLLCVAESASSTPQTGMTLSECVLFISLGRDKKSEGGDSAMARDGKTVQGVNITDDQL